MYYERTGAEFLGISRATSKIKDISCNCKQFYSMGALEQFLKISRATSKTEDFSRDHKQL